MSLIYTDKVSEAEDLDATVQSERYNRIRAIARELGDTAIARAKMRIAEANKRAEVLYPDLYRHRYPVLCPECGCCRIPEQDHCQTA